ncbi:RHS repeat protein [Escherichia coli]
MYDERGNLLAVTDPLQQNTRYQYDRHGQVVQITDARGGINTSSGMKTGSSCGTRTVPARRRPGSTTNARGLSE